jgi:galactonate dehydratase
MRTTMRITEITSYPVEVGAATQLLVKIETDEGIYGWGECGLANRNLAVQGALAHYREFLLGRDPMQRGALWQEMYRSQYFEGGRVLTAAISGIDIALHDIAGKKLGVAVYELLGGKHRDFVPTFATGGGGSSEEMVDVAKQIIAAGFNCMRMHREMDSEHNDGVFEPR